MGPPGENLACACLGVCGCARAKLAETLCKNCPAVCQNSGWMAQHIAGLPCYAKNCCLPGLPKLCVKIAQLFAQLCRNSVSKIAQLFAGLAETAEICLLRKKKPTTRNWPWADLSFLCVPLFPKENLFLFTSPPLPFPSPSSTLSLSLFLSSFSLLLAAVK